MSDFIVGAVAVPLRTPGYSIEVSFAYFCFCLPFVVYNGLQLWRHLCGFLYETGGFCFAVVVGRGS